MSASLQFMAEFYLRNKRHLKGSTITSLVALNSMLAVPTDGRKTKIPEFHSLLWLFFLEDQRAKFCPPAWDFNMVLKSLHTASFESLNCSFFFNVTKKA